MRFTPVLRKQVLARLIKQAWFAHSKHIPYDTNVDNTLIEKGFNVVDSKDILNPKPNIQKFVMNFDKALIQRPPARDETHPDWQEKPCFTFDNHELLIQGTDQAQVLTKTVILKDGLPDRIEALLEEPSEETNNMVKRIIRSSNIFDPHQEKLPKRKDPSRPAWNFPREYGITAVRKSDSLFRRMIQLCEFICDPTISKERQLVRSGVIQVALEKEGNLLLMNHTVDFIMATRKKLSPMGNFAEIENTALPDLHPMISTVGFQKRRIYKPVDMYPISEDSPWINPHTIFFNRDFDRVKNLTELPINQNQILARSLMKAFVTAAGCARQKYGKDIKDLPEPVTLHCVQSDGQSFHFTVFQLNTLNIDGDDGRMNFWWSTPQIDLFEKAGYESGRPVLEGYNPEVFKKLLAFYRNV